MASRGTEGTPRCGDRNRDRKAPRLAADTSGDLATAGFSLEETRRAAAYADGTTLADAAVKRIRQETGLGTNWDWLVGSIGGELLRGFFWRHEMLSLKSPGDVDYAVLLACRLCAGRELDRRWLGKDSPSIEDHDQVLLAPVPAAGRAGPWPPES
jgi:hypothetical protein